MSLEGKSLPLQARGFQEVKVTVAQDCGEVVSHTHRPFFTPGNTPGTHFC